MYTLWVVVFTEKSRTAPEIENFSVWLVLSWLNASVYVNFADNNGTYFENKHLLSFLSTWDGNNSMLNKVTCHTKMLNKAGSSAVTSPWKGKEKKKEKKKRSYYMNNRGIRI